MRRTQRKLRFNADKWMGDITIRLLSPSAKSVLIDLASVMNGEYKMRGPAPKIKLITFDQLAQICSIPGETGFRDALVELMDAGLVTQNGGGAIAEYSLTPGLFDPIARRKARA